MIVKNEEEVLARCLDGVKAFADEIIIADTGSEDSTVAIAEKYTDKIFSFDWCDDFSAARNFSFSKATCDLVMWLDADDVVEDKDAAEICRLKEQMKDYDMAFLEYIIPGTDGRPLMCYCRERIFRRTQNYVWEGAVHEAISPRGRILYSSAKIVHKKVRPSQPMRNLRIYQKIISQGGKLCARDRFYYGRELFYNGMYCESCAVLEDFLAGNGWIENKAEACIMLYSAYLAEGKVQKATSSLLKSFEYGLPKSRVCCLLGERFFSKGDFETSIFWYKTAAALPQNICSGAFIDCDSSAFIPYMQLCVIYDRMGDYKKACYYNNLAGSIRPDNPGYLYNKRYFKEKHQLG